MAQREKQRQMTKVLYRINSGRGDVTDQGAFNAFRTACLAIHRYDGIGMAILTDTAPWISTTV